MLKRVEKVKSEIFNSAGITGTVRTFRRHVQGQQPEEINSVEECGAVASDGGCYVASPHI